MPASCLVPVVFRNLWLGVGAALLLAGCQPGPPPGRPFEAVELFSFDGWESVRAFKVDSLGHVQTLYVNNNEHDSTLTCFTLSLPQLDELRRVADSLATAMPRKKRGSCSDCGITKAVIYQRRRTAVHDSHRQEAPPQLRRLSHLLFTSYEQQAGHGCRTRFTAPQLMQGYEGMFRLYRPK